VELPLFVIKHHAMRTNGPVRVRLHEFLTSAREGGDGELHASVSFIRLDITPELTE
jgi:hypothetical protein